MSIIDSTKGRAAILLPTCAFFLMATLLCHYLGYEDRTDWNDSAVETTCTVLDHRVTEDQCSYSCNCYRSCSGSGKNKSCHTRCDTCYKDCYDAQAQFEYDEYTKWLTVDEDNDSESDAWDALEKEYPIDYSEKCYYQPDDPNDMSLEKKSATVFLVFTVIFAIITGALFFGFIGWELLECLY